MNHNTTLCVKQWLVMNMYYRQLKSSVSQLKSSVSHLDNTLQYFPRTKTATLIYNNLYRKQVFRQACKCTLGYYLIDSTEFIDIAWVTTRICEKCLKK